MKELIIRYYLHVPEDSNDEEIIRDLEGLETTYFNLFLSRGIAFRVETVRVFLKKSPFPFGSVTIYGPSCGYDEEKKIDSIVPKADLHRSQNPATGAATELKRLLLTSSELKPGEGINSQTEG